MMNDSDARLVKSCSIAFKLINYEIESKRERREKKSGRLRLPYLGSKNPNDQ